MGPVPDPSTGQHALTEMERGGVPEALDGLHVEYLRRSREAGLLPLPATRPPRARTRTGSAEALDDVAARRHAFGRRRGHGEQHIVRARGLA